MINAYPIIISQTGKGEYLVTIPDFDIKTQGTSIPNAIYMARDAIGLIGIDIEDDNKILPHPSSIHAIKVHDADIKTLVDIDFTEYRRKNRNTAVKKNCTIPSWLNEQASAKGINFSNVLQEALKERLGI